MDQYEKESTRWAGTKSINQHVHGRWVGNGVRREPRWQRVLLMNPERWLIGSAKYLMTHDGAANTALVSGHAKLVCLGFVVFA